MPLPRTALDLTRCDPRQLSPQETMRARALDRAAVRALGMPSLLLMENAARAVASTARELLGDGAALVLAGKGNNGGDGLAAARFLSPRVRVALFDRPDPERSPDAARQLAILEAAAVPIHLAPEELDVLADGVTVLIDALLGTGLESAPRGALASWIRWANQSGIPVVAVDLPSGLSADTGAAFDPCVAAARTVTFARPKRGLLRGDGPSRAGHVVVASLGIPEDWIETCFDREG